MPELAFVAFHEGKNTGWHRLFEKYRLLKYYIGMALYHLIYGKKFDNGIGKIIFDNTAEILAIVLPFQKSSLSIMNKQYLTRYISRVCSKNDCVRCFFPPDERLLSDMQDEQWLYGIKQYASVAGIRLAIFKCLLMPILNEIYVRQGVRLDHIDIAFVCGDDPGGLLTMVRELEPFVKCLGIAVRDKQSVEAGLTDIANESGLSIFTGGDFNSILGSTDLILNLGDPSAISYCRIRPQTLVVNFTGAGYPVLRGEFPVINGVEYAFRDEQYDGLGRDVLLSYRKAGLAELFMALKAGLFNGFGYNNTNTRAVTDVYKSYGCHITGFIGRRGILRPDELAKTLGILH